MTQPPWKQFAAPTPVPAPGEPPPGTTTAPVVTPALGPPSQEPPKPIVLQNAAVGLATTAATNMMTTGLTGDPDILKFSLVCNGFAQLVKHHPHFNEKLWTLPFMMLVGVVAAVYFYHDPGSFALAHWWTSISPKGVIDGIISAVQAAMNYGGLKATGVSPMQPVAFENSMEARRLATA